MNRWLSPFTAFAQNAFPFPSIEIKNKPVLRLRAGLSSLGELVICFTGEKCPYLSHSSAIPAANWMRATIPRLCRNSSCKVWIPICLSSPHGQVSMFLSIARYILLWSSYRQSRPVSGFHHFYSTRLAWHGLFQIATHVHELIKEQYSFSITQQYECKQGYIFICFSQNCSS